MPELPEVEAVRRQLQRVMAGDQINASKLAAPISEPPSRLTSLPVSAGNVCERCGAVRSICLPTSSQVRRC